MLNMVTNKIKMALSEPGQKPGTKQTSERPWHHQRLGEMQRAPKLAGARTPTFLQEGMAKLLQRKGKWLEDSPLF